MDAPVDVVIAVKELQRAKSRLVGTTRQARRPGRAHQDLALALAADTLAAVLAAGVRSVTLVSPDPRVRAMAGELWEAGEQRDGGARWRVGTGVEVVADDGAGLDTAVGIGARAARARMGTDGRVAALQADLPALRPAELDAALAALDTLPGAAAFVADHTGEGTTMLVGRPGALPEPHFGPGSAAAHAASGALALPGEWPGLRLDVDTPADLARARTLGVGSATRARLRQETLEGQEALEGQEPFEGEEPLDGTDDGWPSGADRLALLSRLRPGHG